MKYMKMLGLLAIATAALPAFVGTASATITSPPGTVYSGPVKASSSNISLDGSVKVACSSASFEGTAENGATSGNVEGIASISNCGSDTVSILSKGSAAIASSGAVTSTGAEVTVQLHRSVFGIPITTHCMYKTNVTAVGTLTEGVSPAVFHIGSAPIPEMATDAACGNDAVLTGSFTINTPSSAIVVD